MKRPLAASLVLFGVAIVFVPGGGATQVELGADGSVDVDADIGAGLEIPDEEISFDVANVLIASGDGVAQVDLGGQGSGEGAADAAAAPEGDGGSNAVLRGADEATVATAATGVALLAGLAAYHWGSLKFALAGLCMPLFSRIASNHLLDNGVRQRVHEAVTENPGITIKEITQLCSIGWGTAVYHLKRLEAERLVVSERQRQFRRFYKNGGGIVNDAKAAFGELKNPTGERIARRILASPGSCQKDVCEAVGISAPLAHKYLSRLEDAGLVATHREWRTVKYFPTPKLEDLLLVNKPAEAAPLPLAVPLAVAA